MQSKADFLCPIWAPIRFVLKVSEDHTRATEQILLLLETLDRAIIHVNIYEELEPDGEISAALLGLWSDIVDYCIRASQHYGRRTVKRLVSLIGKPYKSRFSKMRENIRDRMTDLHRLVLAKEALRESQAREGERRIRLQGQRNRCIKRLRPPNMTAVHQQQLGFRMNGTCEWIQSNQEFLDWKTTQLSSVTERVLAISGTHGCGKSVLASAIAQSLEVDGHSCVFFAFYSSDAERQTADSLVRSLIAHHLQRADEQIFDAFCGSLEAGQQPTTTQLWSSLNYGKKIRSQHSTY